LLGIFILLTAGFLIAFSTPFPYLYLYPSEFSKFIFDVFFAALLAYVLTKYSIGTFAGRAFLIILLAFFVYRSADALYSSKLEQIKQYFAAHPLKKVPRSAVVPSADCFSHDIRPLLNSNMRYSPRLVFQSYSAYTPLLLAWNAAHFEYDSGPDCVFYGVQEIDGKLPSAFDSLALLRIVNNYEPVPGTKLLRKKKHRPAAARLTENGTIRSGFYRKIDLPRNAPYIWATVEIQDSPAGFVLKTLVKPAAVLIRLELDDGRIAEHRIIPENCGVPFLLSPYLPSWDQVDALLEAKEQKLPGVASFSVCPVFYRDGSGYRGRGLGEWFFRKAITVRFYRMEQSSGR
ncbi:MAG: hypothetical protein J5806_00660, partial [Lentisphaeria bacterium]|nr:hypothetical protein [Lentisphaeria bacterium]